MTRRLLARAGAVLALTTVAATGLTACGGSGTITTSAVFSDVSDLAVGAPVQMADVPVGSVKQISLDGDAARVTMQIQKSANVPANVTAEVERTTVLGERIIQLVPGSGSGTMLADGSTIQHTSVVPDLEQLIAGGTQAFGSISANQLGVLVDSSAQGFGNQGDNLRRLLDDFNNILAAYSHQTGTIQSVLDNLNQFGSASAPDAQANAQAITNLAHTTAILAQQSGRFNDLLSALDSLSTQGRAILQSYLPQMSDQIKGLAAVTSAIANSQQDLAQVLKYLPGHNKTLELATFQRMVQVLEDIEVCGVPGGGDAPDPVDNCHLGGQG